MRALVECKQKKGASQISWCFALFAAQLHHSRPPARPVQHLGNSRTTLSRTSSMQVSLASARAAGPALQQQQQLQQQPQQHVGCRPFRAGSWRAVSGRRLQRLQAEAEGERTAAQTGVFMCGGGVVA